MFGYSFSKFFFFARVRKKTLFEVVMEVLFGLSIYIYFQRKKQKILLFSIFLFVVAVYDLIHVLLALERFF
jgi:hypothetical protein